MDARDPPPSPEVLEAMTPTTKIIYLYLEPYREARVTVAQLEERLGVSPQPAHEALRDLRRLGLVSLLANVRGHPRGA